MSLQLATSTLHGPNPMKSQSYVIITPTTMDTSGLGMWGMLQGQAEVEQAANCKLREAF